MVELTVKEYHTLFNWFERVFGKGLPKDIPLLDRRVFWKLTFLAEDAIKEEILTDLNNQDQQEE